MLLHQQQDWNSCKRDIGSQSWRVDLQRCEEGLRQAERAVVMMRGRMMVVMRRSRIVICSGVMVIEIHHNVGKRHMVMLVASDEKMLNAGDRISNCCLGEQTHQDDAEHCP